MPLLSPVRWLRRPRRLLPCRACGWASCALQSRERPQLSSSRVPKPPLKTLFSLSSASISCRNRPPPCPSSSPSSPGTAKSLPSSPADVSPYGGHFTGALNAELEILLKAAETGCHIVDVEIESVEHCTRAQLTKFRAALRAAGTALLISSHDFTRTRRPDGLNQVAKRIAAYEPEFVKVVTTARSLTDNLAVLQMIEDQSLASLVVGIAMGEEGIISRVLSPRAGAAFTFASAAEGIETAAGQISARTLLDLYRLEQLDPATRIFGVAGNPIAHSLSPVMHATAFRRENLNAIMLPLKVRTLDDLLTVVRDLPLDGVAVTMPLKQEVLPHLANMDPLTARIGACNTLRTGADGKLYGFNTDVAGVVRPLERRMRLKGARILVLGAGGAARAAVFGLVEQGAEIYIVNRTHEKAVALARKAKAHVLKQNVLSKQRFDAIINTTPLRHDRHQAAAPHQRKRA